MQAQICSDASMRAARLRALAARLRNDAEQTAMPEFRRKMQATASELEEAAVDMETRAIGDGQRREPH